MEIQASVPGLLPQDVLRAALAGIDSQAGCERVGLVEALNDEISRLGSDR